MAGENIETLLKQQGEAFDAFKGTMVEIDKEVNSNFAGMPGFVEFRTWYGEPGDNLGFAGTPPAAKTEEASAKPVDTGAGY